MGERCEKAPLSSADWHQVASARDLVVTLAMFQQDGAKVEKELAEAEARLRALRQKEETSK